MDITYIGSAHRRIVTAEDLAGKGVTDFKSTTWAKGEAHAVSEAGGQWLVENLPTQFARTMSAAQLATSKRKAIDSTNMPSSGN